MWWRLLCIIDKAVSNVAFVGKQLFYCFSKERHLLKSNNLLVDLTYLSITCASLDESSVKQKIESNEFGIPVSN